MSLKCPAGEEFPNQSLSFLAVPSGTRRLCQQEHDTDAPGSEALFDRCGVAALTVTPVGVELPGTDYCFQAAQWDL